MSAACQARPHFIRLAESQLSYSTPTVCWTSLERCTYRSEVVNGEKSEEAPVRYIVLVAVIYSRYELLHRQQEGSELISST